MAFEIVHDNLLHMKVDAIVNMANVEPTVGKGFEFDVYQAAGYYELLNYRSEFMGFVEEGNVFITPGFALPVKFIIHAVCPVYRVGKIGAEAKLRSCYRKSLRIAKFNGVKSIAFPVLATGEYGYPESEAKRIALEEINSFLKDSDMDIYLSVMNKPIFRQPKATDIPALRTLIRDSEAVWGFDEEFLQTFDEIYNVTEEFIKKHTSFVMMDNDKLVGFWGVYIISQRERKRGELEFFYVDSKQIRKGYGTQLWKHMIAWCEQKGIKRIDFVTSEPAVEFYKKCGAVPDGTMQSGIDGRDIPMLHYDLK